MSCPYEGRCSEENIKCLTCTHGENRSHYVEYHEYPSSKSIEWPYLPTGGDMGYPIDRLHVQRPTCGDTDTPTNRGPTIVG